MGAGRRRPVCGGVPYGSVQAKRMAGNGSLHRVGASVGEEPMKETAAAEINVGEGPIRRTREGGVNGSR
jgi:hypothetical protein